MRLISMDQMNMFPAARFLMLAAVLTVFPTAEAALASPDEKDSSSAILGRPGYLIIEAAADSASGFVWETNSEGTDRILVWDQGRLTVPATVETEVFARHDLGLICTADLQGTGASGHLALQDGIFPISESIVLSDGILELELTGGEIEILGSRIRYRRTTLQNPEFRSGLLLLSCMTLLIIVLLRRARIKAEERTRN
jgi:hypothetical protein